MTTLAQSLRVINKPWQWIAMAVTILVIWIFVASTPHLYRTSQIASRALPQRELIDSYAPKDGIAVPASQALKAEVASGATGMATAAADRKIIRTSSMEIVVQHPADVAEKITALAESMGGYLETENSGGQNATAGTLTIRIPSARFEQVRAEVRKLGLRVENERVDAQDVTRQYVDQDARIRNLRAEEAQFLAILKQATTVKDMLAVSERLSEARGEIERQQAEFNALSKQIDTVAIVISLRTESETQLPGLNWRPGYELKIALHDGLESVATYATAMTTILFYLPAVILWTGTILFGIAVSWRVTKWVATKWFGWRPTVASTQG